MEKYIGKNDVPMGLGMALAQNVEAMRYFSSLPDTQKKDIIAKTQKINSKSQMQAFVDSQFK